MKKVEDMTIREFLEEVANTEDIKKNYNYLAQFAQKRLEIMTKQNEKRKSKSNSKTTENLELYKAIILPILEKAKEPITVKAIRESIKGTELTSSKITAILKVAEKKKLVEQVQPEKKSHPMRYKLIQEEEEEQVQEEK